MNALSFNNRTRAVITVNLLQNCVWVQMFRHKQFVTMIIIISTSGIPRIIRLFYV